MLREAGHTSHARTHGSGAEHAGAPARPFPFQQQPIPTYSRSITGKFLPQRDRYGILQTGTSHLDHIGELRGLGVQSRLKVRSGLENPAHFIMDGDPLGGRHHVVGGLAHVDVGIGMDLIRALVSGKNLIGPVRQHFVGGHIEGGTRSPENTQGKIGIEGSVRHFVAGPHDGIRLARIERADFLIGQGARLLHLGDGLDEGRIS